MAHFHINININDDLTKAYRLKEKYRVFNLSADYETCDETLNDLIDEFRNSTLDEFRSFGRTLLIWQDEIKNSFIRVHKSRISNGPIESTNKKIKTVIKTSNGVRKFTRFRNRVLYSINKDIDTIEIWLTDSIDLIYGSYCYPT